MEIGLIEMPASSCARPLPWAVIQSISSRGASVSWGPVPAPGMSVTLGATAADSIHPPLTARYSAAPMSFVEAAAQADELAQAGAERELAMLRKQWEDELESAARSSDYRERAVAYRAIGQFRFRQKLELLRRGLEDESPAARGSALIALESLSRGHPGDVNAYRSLLHELAARAPNVAVRRLAVICLKNGSPHRATIHLPEGIAESAGSDAGLRKARRAIG